MVATDRTSKWLRAVNETTEPLPTNPAVLKQDPRGPQRPQKGVRRRAGIGVPRQADEGEVPPLWVMGTLKVEKGSNDLADAAYALDASKVRVVVEEDL